MADIRDYIDKQRQRYIESQKNNAIADAAQAFVDIPVPQASAVPLDEAEAEEIGFATTTPLPEEEEIVELDFNELSTEAGLQDLEDGLREEMQTPMSRQFTDYALPVVKSWESFEPEAYFATDNERERGIATVGYGQTEGVQEGDVQSEEEAEAYLTSQLERTGSRLEEELGDQWTALSPAQQAAVSSLAYNVDKDVVGQFKKSKAFKGLKEGDYDKFITEAFDPEKGFVRQDGKILRGLQRRRQAEKNLFLYGDEYDTASLDNNFLNA